MAEVQIPPKKAAAQKKEPTGRSTPRGKVKGEKHARRSAGRLRVRKEEAAYRRADDERTREIRAQIDAALQAASRIREEIEAKIEQRLHQEKAGAPTRQQQGRARPERWNLSEETRSR